MTAKTRKTAGHTRGPARRLLDVPDDATWVGIGEAAKRAGVSEGAIRKWIRADVPTRTGNGPRGERTEVPLEVIVTKAQAQITGQTRLTVTGSSEPGTALSLADAFVRLENLTGQLVEQGERAARAEVRAEMLTRQIADLTAERDRLLADVERLRTPERRGGLFRRREA